MTNLISEFFTSSTADDASNYFTGEQPIYHSLDVNGIMPPAVYRIVGGSLERVVDDPEITPATITMSLLEFQHQYG